MSKKIDKLKQIIAKPKRSWLEEAIAREENDLWIQKSQKIAMKILFELDNQGITQSALATKLFVSASQINRIVKGHENLTLETICKLERALGIELIGVSKSINVESEPVIQKPTILRMIQESKFAYLSETQHDYKELDKIGIPNLNSILTEDNNEPIVNVA
ncbi:MAG: helix-turn-helix domain-containing protein [Bacteroidetes bacterium]|nr:helix-turn-helix domain-containing protein [Bacteroidota bacterium]